jgi:hypothetical protein
LRLAGHDLGATLRHIVNKCLIVVRLVGDQAFERDVFNQRSGLRGIAGLSRGESDADRVAESVSGGMNFGGESATASSEGLFSLFSPLRRRTDAPVQRYCR